MGHLADRKWNLLIDKIVHLFLPWTQGTDPDGVRLFLCALNLTHDESPIAKIPDSVNKGPYRL